MIMTPLTISAEHIFILEIFICLCFVGIQHPSYHGSQLTFSRDAAAYANPADAAGKTLRSQHDPSSNMLQVDLAATSGPQKNVVARVASSVRWAKIPKNHTLVAEDM